MRLTPVTEKECSDLVDRAMDAMDVLTAGSSSAADVCAAMKELTEVMAEAEAVAAEIEKMPADAQPMMSGEPLERFSRFLAAIRPARGTMH